MVEKKKKALKKFKKPSNTKIKPTRKPMIDDRPEERLIILATIFIILTFFLILSVL